MQHFNFKTGQGQAGLDDNVLMAQEQLTSEIKGEIFISMSFFPKFPFSCMSCPLKMLWRSGVIL